MQNLLTPIMLMQDNKEFLEYILDSNIINNIIVFVFIVWLLKKTDILGVISKKQDEIATEIATSETEKRESEKTLTAVNSELKNIDSVIVKMKDDAKEIAASLVEGIKKDEEKQLKEILHKTSKIKEEEKNKAYSEVSTSVSKAALSVAEKHIKQSIDEDLHKKFIYEFIDDLDNVQV